MAIGLGRMFGFHAERQPPIDHFYEPGQALSFGECTVDILHTPGHCPGGVGGPAPADSL
jgi:glyoxylase-like metal-dependent hydrolase (beta-lactamase superfamily II)